MVTLITKPQADFALLAQLPEEPSRSLDELSQPINTLKSCVSMLSNFAFLSKADPLKNPLYSALDHLHFSFLVEGEGIDWTRFYPKLKFLKSYDLHTDRVIVTGSLLDWRISLLQEHYNRVVFVRIFEEFQELGLGNLWFGYKRITCSNRILE